MTTAGNLAPAATSHKYEAENSLYINSTKRI
jgi:hypothetical protein